jgi:predicted nucleotidyltransferase
VRPSVALEKHRGAIRTAARRYRLANPRVFGSAARGADTSGSDLDLLVDPLPDATLFDLGGFQEEIEALLGVQVDVRTLGDLPGPIRARVLAELKPV